MESSARYRILGERDLHTSRHVTEVLGIAPTEALEAGDPIRQRPAHTYENASWELNTSPASGRELAESIQQLLVQLEPASTRLWDLQAEGYWCNWLCTVGADHGEHAAELDRQTLTRLLSLPGELWLDVYTSHDPNQGASEFQT